MKPHIRMSGGLWICGPSIHPRLGIGPPCGTTPAKAYEAAKFMFGSPIPSSHGKAENQVITTWPHPVVWQ